MSLPAPLLAMVVPLAIWALVLHFVLALLLAIEEGRRHLQRLHRVPCYRCRFYTGSPYLKCPVHPLDAGSEAALHCRDYAPGPPPHRPRSPKPSAISSPLSPP